MQTFSVTYETVTPESAAYGDAEDRGYVVQGVSLRDALAECEGADHIEADCYPVDSPRWFTFYDVREDLATGEHESRSLHLPETLSESSRLRIARLIGCYGV